MKTTPLIHLVTVLAALIVGLSLLPKIAQAQDNLYPEDAYSQAELAQMLAPIALYPDALLSQVLMASTYPIEVIEASRWLNSHPGLQGEALEVALMAENWDPSVKTLCQFPSVLALMSERIGETTDLGNAFLAQEEEVMDMIQELRSAASAQGNLATTSRQQVIIERETIIIKPANPRVIYVPYYDPLTIYGSWWYPAYPPYYWGPSGGNVGRVIAYRPGIYFAFSFGTWSTFDWHRRHIFIDAHKLPRYVRHDQWVTKPGRWQHAPSHRRGVTYFRRDTRGFQEHRNTNRVLRSNTLRPVDTHPSHQARQQVHRNHQQSIRVESDPSVRQRVEAERFKRETREIRGHQRGEGRQERIPGEHHRPQGVRRDGNQPEQVVEQKRPRQPVDQATPERSVNTRQPQENPEIPSAAVTREERHSSKQDTGSSQGGERVWRGRTGSTYEGKESRNDQGRTRR